MDRIIFHIDVNNAFLSWTAVYLLKQGEKIDIRTIPSIIAGDEKQRRGIVLAKSPVAKKYGIKTAETIYSAKKKCPGLKVYPPSYEMYKIESEKMYKYLCQYTPVIQRYSIDECFIDLTGTNFIYKDYIELAYKIKEDIKRKFGFTVNIGIGNNRLCAKMASDFEKPDRVHTLYNNEIKEKMWPLPIEDLFMVGNKTAEKMKMLNINKIGDLANMDIEILKRHFKNQAQFYKEYALGIDNSKVEQPKEVTDSISMTETLPYDYKNKKNLQSVLLHQTNELTKELREKKQFVQTVGIIYKNNKFEKYTHQTKLEIPLNNAEEIYEVVLTLFNRSWKEDAIRNIGIRFSELTKTKTEQMSLFAMEKKEERNDIQEVIDKINKKYNTNALTIASMRDRDK